MSKIRTLRLALMICLNLVLMLNKLWENKLL